MTSKRRKRTSPRTHKESSCSGDEGGANLSGAPRDVIEEPEIKIPATEEISSASAQKIFQNMIAAVLIFMALGLGVTLRYRNLHTVTMRSPDERTYAAQAKTLSEKGLVGVRERLTAFNADKEMWDLPHPVRVGYLGPYAALMKVMQNDTPLVGSYLSVFFSVISLLLVLLIGIRVFNPWVTLYGVLFMAVSAFPLAISRRGWQEAMIGCLGLALIYCCCEITRNTRRNIWVILFILIGSYSLLVKATCGMFYLLGMIWICWVVFAREKDFVRGAVIVAASGLGAGASILFLSYAAGGLPPVLEAVGHMKAAAAVSRYALEYCSGNWYEFFDLVWLVDPVNAILFVLGVSGMAVYFKTGGCWQEDSLQDRRAAVGIIFFFAALVAGFLSIKPVSLNLRYLSVLFGPFYLFSGLGVWHILSFVRYRAPRGFVPFTIGLCVFLVLVAAGNYKKFRDVFVRRGTLDLSIGLFRRELDPVRWERHQAAVIKRAQNEN